VHVFNKKKYNLKKRHLKAQSLQKGGQLTIKVAAYLFVAEKEEMLLMQTWGHPV